MKRIDYNYTPEIKEVFNLLKEIKDIKKHEKLYNDAPKEHKPTIKKAYKTALKIALFNLSLALEIWVSHGCKIENNDKEVG